MSAASPVELQDGWWSLNCAASLCQSWGQDMAPFYGHLHVFFNTDLWVKLLSSYYVNCGHCWIDIHMCWCWLMCKWPNLLPSPSKPFVQEQVSTLAVLWWCALAACVIWVSVVSATPRGMLLYPLSGSAVISTMVQLVRAGLGCCICCLFREALCWLKTSYCWGLSQ